MARYTVTMTTTASVSVTVEAHSEAEAEELAWNVAKLPYFPAGMDGDLADWETNSIEEMPA